MLILRDDVDLMEVDKQVEEEEEIMADGEVDDFKDDETKLEQFKIVHHKKDAVHKVPRSSVRVESKNMKILEKATAKKEQDFQKAGLSSSSYTVFNSFDPLHFVNIASTSGIILDNDISSEREAVNVMLAKEKADAMLTEARKRKEEEIRREKKKSLQITKIEGEGTDCDVNNREEKSSSDERGECSSQKIGRQKRA
jgi:hypothetical protein